MRRTFFLLFSGGTDYIVVAYSDVDGLHCILKAIGREATRFTCFWVAPSRTELDNGENSNEISLAFSLDAGIAADSDYIPQMIKRGSLTFMLDACHKCVVQLNMFTASTGLAIHIYLT